MPPVCQGKHLVQGNKCYIFSLQFDKTEADLDYMSRKLDAEFANVNDGAAKVSHF